MHYVFYLGKCCLARGGMRLCGFVHTGLSDTCPKGRKGGGEKREGMKGRGRE